jgi:hypothetical protein
VFQQDKAPDNGANPLTLTFHPPMSTQIDLGASQKLDLFTGAQIEI